MIAINRPPKNPSNPKSKPKILSLTQKDVDPISSHTPIFFNEKLYPSSIECYLNENGSHQICKFIDKYGKTSTIKNIGFINQQVSQSTINVYKHPDGTLRTRMDFKGSVLCEIFGVYPSFTLKCQDYEK